MTTDTQRHTDRIIALVGAPDARRLQRISGSLHRIDERWCNEEMGDATTARVERREAALQKEAAGIAWTHGLRIYLQSDPRGWPLYLWAQADLDAYNSRRGDPITIDCCYSSIATGISPRKGA